MPKPMTWEDILNKQVPDWANHSEKNRRRIMAKAVPQGYVVDYYTGLVTRRKQNI